MRGGGIPYHQAFSERKMTVTGEQAVSYLLSFDRFAGGPEQALSAMRALMQKLGNPQNSLRVIHVAGTNGKGSVVTFCAAMLERSGFRVGKYLSPYVLEFRERIQINGEMIPFDRLAALTERVRAAVERSAAEGYRFTAFHVTTALAFCYFAEEQCDFVCLEVGLGGRGDCTNLIPPPEVAVITPISPDHTAVLGNTVEEIAAEKAGILKAGSTAVIAAGQPPAALAVLRRAAAERGMPVIEAEKPAVLLHTPARLTIAYHGNTYELGMTGGYQAENAATALTVMEVLRRRGIALPEPALRQGLWQARIPARMERLWDTPLFFLDGAHNPAGAAACAAFASRLPRPRVLISAVMRDKNVSGITDILFPLFDVVFCPPLSAPRACPPQELAARAANARVSSSLQEALIMAKKEAGKDGSILAAGSLYLASEIRPLCLSDFDKNAR